MFACGQLLRLRGISLKRQASPSQMSIHTTSCTSPGREGLSIIFLRKKIGGKASMQVIREASSCACRICTRHVSLARFAITRLATPVMEEFPERVHVVISLMLL